MEFISLHEKVRRNFDSLSNDSYVCDADYPMYFRYRSQIENDGDNPCEKDDIPNFSIHQNVCLCRYDEAFLCKLSWLTISQKEVRMRNLNLSCKIHVTSRASLIAEFCKFEPIRKTCECTVEVFASSNAKFSNCEFKSGNKACVVYRDKSQGELNECIFHDNSNMSLLVMKQSYVDVMNCIFEETKRFSVYVLNDSKAKLCDCKFSKQEGKAMFLLRDVEVHVIGCMFKNCGSGGITMAENSCLYVSNCIFKNIINSSIHALKNSTVRIEKCSFECCKGNGVNFDNSNGYIYKSYFSNFVYPAIACFGCSTNPVIYQCYISNSETLAFVSRDFAIPSFISNVIDGTKSHGFSISDFSQPLIKDNKIMNIGDKHFSIGNGAKPIIFNNDIEIDKNNPIDIFTTGNPLIFYNRFINRSNIEKLSLNIHHHGILQEENFLQNIIMLDNNKFENIKKIKYSDNKFEYYSERINRDDYMIKKDEFEQDVLSSYFQTEDSYWDINEDKF